jgi:hypothetical protein
MSHNSLAVEEQKGFFKNMFYSLGILAINLSYPGLSCSECREDVVELLFWSGNTLQRNISSERKEERR